MKTITRFTAKYSWIVLLLFAEIASAQIINIPDANFKNVLVNTNCAQVPPATVYSDLDTNNDGEIDVSEAAVSINTLNLTGANISSLEGIQYFTNVGELMCSDNHITTLDLSGLPHVDALYCANNGMTSLIINQTEIKGLICNNNLLTSIDFKPTGTPGAEAYIDVSNNLLTSLDLPDYMDMYDTVNVSGNLFTTFSIVSSQLQNFQCSNNPNLVSLDFSSVSRLFNKFITNNPNLQFINFKNGWVDFCDSNPSYPGGCHFTDSSPVLTNNPSLQYICADEQDLDGIAFSIGAQSVAYSTYCSFVPGGSHNTITGNILFDADNNGCDTNDIPQPGIKVGMGMFGSTFTTAAGNYTFYTGAGNYTITPAIENPTFFSFSPATVTVPFADANSNVATQNFCISANGVHPDIEVAIAPIIPARPGFDAVYQVVYKNKGNQVLSGNIIFNYDDSILDFVSATTTPDSQSVGTLNWNYSNLLPFENRNFYITLNVNSPVETPAVNVNDILAFIATANPNTNDETPPDNVFEFHQTVVGSIDPNEKQCVEGNTIEPSEIGKYLHYIISFENLGTATAENVVIRDVIDTTMFDINSLQVMNSSGPIDVKVTGNIVEFIFKNLNLPIGGHGNVLFKIKTLPTLEVGDEVANTAHIYFDYNAPVATNEARTAFTLLTDANFPKDSSIAIYPNPTKSNISISAKNNIQSIALFDIQGRILQTSIENKPTVTFDISNQQSGIYFLKVISAAGSNTQKIIKQ